MTTRRFFVKAGDTLQLEKGDSFWVKLDVLEKDGFNAKILIALVSPFNVQPRYKNGQLRFGKATVSAKYRLHKVQLMLRFPSNEDITVVKRTKQERKNGDIATQAALSLSQRSGLEHPEISPAQLSDNGQKKRDKGQRREKVRKKRGSKAHERAVRHEEVYEGSVTPATLNSLLRLNDMRFR